MLRAVLLVEELGVDAVGVSLQGQRVVARVREDRRRDARVVIDDLCLREPDLGIQDLLEVGELENAIFDLDLDRGFLSHLRAPPSVQVCRCASL